MTPVDPKHVEKAHALAKAIGVARILAVAGNDNDIQAIARALQDADDAARDEENRACERELEERIEHHARKSDSDDCPACEALGSAKAAIAARRGPG